MSAIWGIVKLDKNAVIREDAYALMKCSYESRCRIDRYSRMDFEDGFFACGIQYVTPQARDEELPCSDGQGIYFTADCMVDNPHGDGPDGRYMFERYSEKGSDAFKELYGAYSAAVWDSRNKVLRLCADPAASRCLYYYCRDGLVVFSTLIEPIRKIFPDITINENYIKDFLIAPALMPSLVSRECAYTGIKKVIQGHYITFSGTDTEETRYFDPTVYNKDMKVRTIKQTDRTFRSVYEQCVNGLLRNEITGVAMSSGLDSSSIAVLAADHIRKAGNGRLLAYTYVPAIPVESPEGKITDETEDVNRIIEANPNIEPHFLNNEGKNCVGQIPEVVSLTEMPIKAVVNFPNLMELYGKASGDGCRVVMNGQFGNSTVSYGRHEDILYDKYCRHRYLSIVSDILHVCRQFHISAKRPLKGFFSEFREHKKFLKHPSMIWDAEYTNKYLDVHIGDGYPVKERFTEAGFVYGSNIPFIKDDYRSIILNYPSFTYIGEFETKIGLRYGIILRDPTRDARMLSLCIKIPYSFFTYHGTPRCLIRRNLRDLIPVQILDNWRRVGEQNSDWIARMERDKPDVIALLKRAFSTETAGKYINIDKVLEDIDGWEKGEVPESNDIMSLLFCYSNTCFLLQE